MRAALSSNEMSGSVLEAFAIVQKDWMVFVHQRIKEDVAVSRRLCGALWARETS
jgi:hypothetical protein